MKFNNKFKTTLAAFAVTSILVASQTATAKEVVVTGQFEGSAPYLDNIGFAGILEEGQPLYIRPLSMNILDADGDLRQLNKDNKVTFYLVDASVADGTLTQDELTALIGTGEIVALEKSGGDLGVFAINIPDNAGGKKIGISYTPETRYGYPAEGQPLISTNIYFKANQKPDGSPNYDSSKIDGGLLDVMGKQDGIIAYKDENMKLVVTRNGTVAQNEIVIDERDGTFLNVTPLASDTFTATLYGGDKDITEEYKDTFTWGYKKDVGDNSRMPGDGAVTAASKYYFNGSLGFPKVEGTTFTVQDVNDNSKLSFFKSAGGEQGHKLIVKFGGNNFRPATLSTIDDSAAILEAFAENQAQYDAYLAEISAVPATNEDAEVNTDANNAE